MALGWRVAAISMAIALIGMGRGCSGWSWVVEGNAADPQLPPRCRSMCFNVHRGNLSSGEIVGLYDCTGLDAPQEQWDYDDASLALFVSTVNGTLCLDAPQLSFNITPAVLVSPCNSSDPSQTQRWMIRDNTIRNAAGYPQLPLGPYLSAEPTRRSFWPLQLRPTLYGSATSLFNFTLVPNSTVQNYTLPLPPSKFFNLVRNTYFYTPVPEARRSFSSFAICDWQMRGSIRSCQELPSCPLPSYANVIVLNATDGDYVTQVIPTYVGEKHELTFQVAPVNNCSSLVDVSVWATITPSSLPLNGLAANISTIPGMDWRVGRVTFKSLADRVSINLVPTTDCNTAITNVQVHAYQTSSCNCNCTCTRFRSRRNML